MTSKHTPQKLYLAFRHRVKDSTTRKELRMLGHGVNQIWNYANAAQLHALKHNSKWPDYGDLHALTKGASKLVGLPSQIVQATCKEYVIKRRAATKNAGRVKLRWRVSTGSKRSLGWIPFTNQDVEIVSRGVVMLRGRKFRFWQHRDLPEGARIKSGCFAEDARGRWYVSFVVEVPRPEQTNRTAIYGADPGFKTVLRGGLIDQSGAMTDFDLDQSRFYRDLEPRLAESQRKGRKRQTKTIHAKIANRRKDAQHKYTRAVVDNAGAIFVGNISSTWQIASGRGKATLDVGWSSLRSQFKYKSEHAGVPYQDVDERFTTQDCSACGARCGPKGDEGLAIRQWVCGGCGAKHDRDGNSALNIARRGCATLGLKWPGSLVL